MRIDSASDVGDGFQMVQYGTWTKVNAENGEVTNGDAWALAKAVSRALHPA